MTILKLTTMNTLEHATLISTLRQSGSYNDSEPMYASVRRIVDERNSERARAERFKTQVSELSALTTHQADRIRFLENEIKRLSHPPGSFIGWRPDPVVHTRPAAPPPAPEPEPAPEIDRSRMGRQRRELRRLNASGRLLRLERDRAMRLVEDAVVEITNLKRALRIAEIK